MAEKVYYKDHTGLYAGLKERLRELRAVAEPEEAMEIGDQEEDEVDFVYQDDSADEDYDEGPIDSGTHDVSEPSANAQLLASSHPLAPDHESRKRRILPNTADFNEYRQWQANVEDMVDAYLAYTARTLGKSVQPAEVIKREDCTCAERRESYITCLHFDRASLLLFQLFFAK